MTGDGDPFANLDHSLAFTLPGRNARGRLVRLGPVLDTILANHQYPPLLARLLAEALVLTALLGSTLRGMDDQLTVQAHSQGGVVDLLVCDYRAGALRGYLRHDPERLAEAPVSPSLYSLFGKGYLAITFDQALTGERYQGIVPLEGASLAEAAERYCAQSEQVPSLVRLAVVDHGDAGHVAGGMIIQHLPQGEEGRERLHTRLDHPEWEHVRALAATLSEEELVDPDLSLEEILWRLFHEEEIRVLPQAALARGCRCSTAHIREVLARFPAEERQTMADGEGVIRVDCAFCARMFPIELVSLGD